jgi:hypothetical protein
MTAEETMRRDVDSDVEVAWRTATEAGVPFFCNANLIAIADAWRKSYRHGLRSGLLSHAAT